MFSEDPDDFPTDYDPPHIGYAIWFAVMACAMLCGIAAAILRGI